MSSASTYRAVHATAPGKLELTTKPLRDPGPGQLRIRVEACGVCHSDSGTVDGVFPIDWPRVPGHEAVGRIDALGDAVQGWSIGQRVGVGFLDGFCGYCEFCRAGDLVNCQNHEFTGIHHDGGYAEVLIAEGGESPSSSSVVGFALFFHNYSTFLTRPGIYLEDLYVQPAHRRRGHGKALLARLAQLAVERGCGRLEWSVLDWNEPSIGFYQSLGAVAMNEWTIYRLTGDALTAMASRSGDW